MNGVVTAVIRKTEKQKGGYGFIRDEHQNERFFHARNLRGVTFDELREGAHVTFTPVQLELSKQGNGLRAEDVALAS